jgi:two-component system OmpR family sensor kinase
MAKHLSLHGLRARLVLAISLITVAVVGGSFVAIHQGTGSELERRIDTDLREQAGEFRQELTDVRTPADLERVAKKYVAAQRYHPESRIFVVTVRGEPTVTNHQDVVTREELFERAERTESGGAESDPTLLDAPDGIASVPTEEAGDLRVLSRPILEGGQRIGTFRVADPRLPIQRAQAGLRYTFLIVGVVALVVSFAVALWVATLITRPLRRMARVATEVDAGDLTHRIGNVGTSDEVSMLADSFDRMLDRLEAAFKRQREFVSDASHELRTPLTVLRGQIELLARGGVEASQREETTQTLLRELDRMNRLVDDMLMLARAEAGEMVEPRALDLADFLDDLERDLPLLGDRDYRVEGTRSGTLSADPDRLSQVFRNLVRNAVGHTKRGDRITVSTTTRDGRIRFAVSDSGPGIPPEQLERIFDRFYRTDAGRGRDRGGSGLGLPIARAIVEAHGGSIKADRSPDGGAAITFELPGYRREAP